MQIRRRTIESVQDAEYALAVSHGTVVEVYQIDQWYPAGTIPMQTRTLDPERCKNRIEFTGKLAPDKIRLNTLERMFPDYLHMAKQIQ